MDATQDFGVDQVCDGIATTLFLDRADEDIDYRIAMALYADCGDLILFDGGNHRFDHMEEAVAIVRARHLATSI